MDWNNIMIRELNRAGTGAKLVRVPDSRRATADSLVKLDNQIAYGISENKIMRDKSSL